MKDRIVVRATWDEEAKVWVATSDDVPGLITEADNLDSLVPKLRSLIPELLDANGYADGDDLHFDVESRIPNIPVCHV
jgi:Domain of unknown function (DUF1902)